MKHRKSSSPYRHHHHHHQHHQNRHRNHHHPNLGVQVGEKNKRLPRIKFLCKEERLILAIRRWDDLWKWMLSLSFLITTITHLVGERENGRSYFYSAGEWTGRREGCDLHFLNIVIQISWWSSSSGSTPGSSLSISLIIFTLETVAMLAFVTAGETACRSVLRSGQGFLHTEDFMLMLTSIMRMVHTAPDM